MLLVLLWLRTAPVCTAATCSARRDGGPATAQAHTDPLTGLANRRLFRQLLANRLDQPGRGLVAVLFADLDNFKSVNDTQGHADGDRLLAEVAERIGELLHEFPESVAARLGGDEFAILLPETEEHAAELLAGRFVTSLGRRYTAAPHVAVTVSVGLAVSSKEDDAGTLLRSADLAMYAAKEEGRDRWARYAPEMHTALVERVELEGQLREGLLRGELVLHYQPTYDLPTGQPRGVEALVRWDHPTRGLLAPAQFIPLAENSDLIIGLGRIVLEQACRQLAAWRASLGELAPVEVAVNVSSVQLHQPGFAAQVQAVLEVTDLPPRCLVLEVTESAVMRDVDAVIEILSDLRALGVRIAIDDFGTGHSSLSRLHELPTDEIKIDQSFVQASHDDATLLELIITLASLGLDVVAEGIETSAQLDTLRQMGCPYGQGYLLDRPLDVDAATAVFAPDAPDPDLAPPVATQAVIGAP